MASIGEPARETLAPLGGRRIAGALAALALVAMTTILWLTDEILTERFTESLAERAFLRSTLHARAVSDTVRTHAMSASLMARDRALVDALVAGESRAGIDAILAPLRAESGTERLFVYSAAGALRGATDIPRIDHAAAPYFSAALTAEQAVFATVTIGERDQSFLFARRIRDGDTVIGLLVSVIALSPLERNWSAGQDRVFVTSADDIILMSTRDDWRFRALTPFLDAAAVPPGVARRNLLPMLNIGSEGSVPVVAIEGTEYLRVTRPLEFRGWTMTYLAPLSEAQARVGAVLALEVTLFAVLAALTSWVTARRASRQTRRVEQESVELRALNARLTREIEERTRVEQSLAIAERTLEQSSKLAALGQMSAAIAHELNQPLAAMKTYLAGAQLLMKRNRATEAVASFQRIDDLITRMNALTQQLKSFSRKGGTDLKEVDLRTVVLEALSIMAPQIKQRRLEIVRTLPPAPVIVRGDALRLEQIAINLIRNAMDAARARDDARVEIEVIGGEELARMQVRDNGEGITGDPDRLFEPFYTTKEAGDGVGLGLAISAQIAGDLGGALTARNLSEGGALFELSLPLITEPRGQAE